MPLRETSSGLACYCWRTADGCDNWLNSRGATEIFGGKISQDFVDFVVLRDAQQLVSRFRAVNSRQTLETRATRLIVFGARKDLRGRCGCVAARFEAVLRDETYRPSDVFETPRDVDLSA